MAKEKVDPRKAWIPEGFEDAAPPKAWVVKEPGTKFQGIVQEKIERGGRDKGKYFYDLLITAPHNLTVQIGPKEGEEGGAPPVPATKGMVVSFDEIARLSDTLDDCWGDAEFEWEVFIELVGKKPHSSDPRQSIWVTHIAKKRLGKRQVEKSR
jgi:hypothetical protein